MIHPNHFRYIFLLVVPVHRGTTVHRGTYYKPIPEPLPTWNFKPNLRLISKEKKNIITPSSIPTNQYELLEDDLSEVNDDDEDIDPSLSEQYIIATDAQYDPNLYGDILPDSGISGSVNSDNMYWDDPDPDNYDTPSTTLSSFVQDMENINNNEIILQNNIKSTYIMETQSEVQPEIEPSLDPDSPTATIEPQNGHVRQDGDMLSVPHPETSEYLKNQSIKAELQQMYDKGVFRTLSYLESTEVRKRMRIIDSIMFSKVKYNANGIFTKWKSRLAARGDQQPALDQPASSPTANLLSINTLLSYGVNQGQYVFTSDVPGAYLHADIDEEVVMRLPKSCAPLWLEITGIDPDVSPLYIDNKGYIYVLVLKAIYGLLQSSVLWFENISATLIDMGFQPTKHDPCVFWKIITMKKYFIAVYVDDLLHICADINTGIIIGDLLTKRYGMMEHHFGTNLSFLSINLQYNHDYTILIMDQHAYLQKFLEEAK